MRVSLDEDIPILQGTTATISASFTGVSTVSLGGAVRGAPPITEPGCPKAPPVIPAEPGGLGEILASAPLLLERLATLTDRLTRLLSDENQASISGILANTDRMSGQLADMAPGVPRRAGRAAGHAGAVDRDARRVRRHAALDRFAAQRRRPEPGRASCARRCSRRSRRRPRSRRRCRTPGRRRASWRRPRCRSPTPRCRNCKRTSAALRAVTERIETEGAGSLVGGTKLPDYEP